MSDLYDDELPPREDPPRGSRDGMNEGVRILGAEEARASLGLGEPANAEPPEPEATTPDTPTPETSIVESLLLDDDEPQLDLRDDMLDRTLAFDSPLAREDEAASVLSGPSSELRAAEAREAREARPGDFRSTASWSASAAGLIPEAPAEPPEPVVAPSAAIAFDAPASESRPLVARLEEAPTGEVPPLPHWTEPPTGAVPAIFADESDSPDELDAWASVTGSQPRFRAEGSDWAESDFADDLSDDDNKLGALSNEGPVDEEAAFARDLAERRRPPRAKTTRTAETRRPARAAAGPTRVDPDLATRDAGSSRDLPTAIMTGLAVAVIAIICFTRTWTTLALAAVIICAATLELASTLQRKGLRSATLVALVAATLMPIAAREYGTAAYPVFFGMIVLVSMLWFLWEITPGRPLPGVASTLLIFAYVGGLGGFSGLILQSHNGIRLLLGVVLCVIAYDVFGFFVGSKFGHTAIAPRVSPNKTVEGTVAGMIAAAIVGAAIVGQIDPWTTGKGLALGVLVAAGCIRRRSL